MTRNSITILGINDGHDAGATLVRDGEYCQLTIMLSKRNLSCESTFLIN